MAGLACFGRIQAYLLAEPRVDERIVLGRSETPQGKTVENCESDSPAHELQELKPAPSQSFTTLQNDIVVKNGCFGWKHRAEEVLQDIELSIEQSTLTILIGPVASGKSTLLKAILGESKTLAGSVYVSSSRISFCDQTVWLRNMSIQENILNFSPLDDVKYNAVIDACALNDDFEQLPNGDQSFVGSKGITLSGGQKQRIVSLPNVERQ